MQSLPRRSLLANPPGTVHLISSDHVQLEKSVSAFCNAASRYCGGCNPNLFGACTASPLFVSHPDPGGSLRRGGDIHLYSVPYAFKWHSSPCSPCRNDYFTRCQSNPGENRTRRVFCRCKLEHYQPPASGTRCGSSVSHCRHDYFTRCQSNPSNNWTRRVFYRCKLEHCQPPASGTRCGLPVSHCRRR